jgi:hypothetical protein
MAGYRPPPRSAHAARRAWATRPARSRPPLRPGPLRGAQRLGVSLLLELRERRGAVGAACLVGFPAAPAAAAPSRLPAPLGAVRRAAALARAVDRFSELPRGSALAARVAPALRDQAGGSARQGPGDRHRRRRGRGHAHVAARGRGTQPAVPRALPWHCRGACNAFTIGPASAARKRAIRQYHAPRAPLTPPARPQVTLFRAGHRAAAELGSEPAPARPSARFLQAFEVEVWRRPACAPV